MKDIKKLGLTGLALLAVGKLLSPASAASGQLNIDNWISNWYSAQRIKVIHQPGAEEGMDGYDIVYSPMFNPSGLSPKIVSKLGESELEIESKSEDSQSLFNLEASVIQKGVQKGDLIAVNSQNELRISLPFAQSYGWDFGNKPITFQQHNPADPNSVFRVYDARKEIAFSDDKIWHLPLPDLGELGSEIPYAYFTVDFTRNPADFNNDRKVNSLDFSILAGQYGLEGNLLADIAISNPDNAFYLSPNTTPYFDGRVDLADVAKFAENWGYGWDSGIKKDMIAYPNNSREYADSYTGKGESTE